MKSHDLQPYLDVLFLGVFLSGIVVSVWLLLAGCDELPKPPANKKFDRIVAVDGINVLLATEDPVTGVTCFTLNGADGISCLQLDGGAK